MPEENRLLAPQFTPGSDEWYANRLFGIGATPTNVKKERSDNAEFIASMLPVVGESMALRDAWNASSRGGNALLQGEFGKAAGEYSNMLSSLAGGLLPLSINKLMQTAMPSDPKNTVFSGAGPTRELPTDEASRNARMKEMGYSDQKFYRGEATGEMPDEYAGGAFFSRDRDTSQGFAERGGQTGPREFRLNLENTFSDAAPLTAGQYGRIVEAAAKQDPELAKNLAETIAPGKGVDWVIGFSKARPDFVVVEKGGAPIVRQAIERGSSDSVGLFRAAGYDAIDTGRDVLKLGGEGIRLKDARFDPRKASSKDIMAGVAGATLLPAWMMSQGSTSRQD